ncbi:MAG: hypothetical protein JWP29_4524 [Rhodoferax sp.]|nr:hypothetical protein [Rhodoferax sp.]
MFYLILTHDKAGAEALRDQYRADHYAYLTAHRQRILASGGLQNDAGDRFIGGMIVLQVDNRAEAEAFAADDPFARAGLFASVRIERWKPAFFNFENAASDPP